VPLARASRPAAIMWHELTEEKIDAIPVLAAMRRTNLRA
jgi:hypothetical protein